MSCKILDSKEAGITPMQWTRAATRLPAGEAMALYAVEPKVDSDATESALESKLRELESAAGQRVREAHTRGRQEGEAAALHQYQTRVEQMASIVQSTAGLRARIRRESEQELVQLSLAIARRILRRELSVDPGALNGIVKACLDRLESRQVQRIRLHPEFAGPVRSHLDPGVEVAGDPRLDPGEVRIETDQGEIDAGMETQLGEIERGFADLLPQRRSSS
jgi:flagellar assembly protein FliH